MMRRKCRHHPVLGDEVAAEVEGVELHDARDELAQLTLVRPRVLAHEREVGLELVGAGHGGGVPGYVWPIRLRLPAVPRRHAAWGGRGDACVARSALRVWCGSCGRAASPAERSHQRPARGTAGSNKE